MRFIYVLLLGLVIFNGMLIVFANAGFFPDATELDKAEDVFEGQSDYKGLSAGLLGTMIGGGLTTAGLIFTGSVLLGVLSKQVGLFLGIGAFASVVGGLWAATYRVIFDIGEYQVVDELLLLLTISIGIVFVFSTIEMLNAQKGVN